MNKSLLVATLLAIALSACSKKEEVAATLPPPATAPALPNAAPTPDTNKPTEPGIQPPVSETVPAAPANPAPENSQAR